MFYLYEIRNILNDKRYIGRTGNVNKRWYRHKNELRKGNHHSLYLQRSWDKYGEDNFEFNILDTRETLNEIIELESSHIGTLNESLLNVSNNSTGGDLISNHPERDKIVEKMTNSLNERYSNMSDEDKLKRSNKLKGENNPNYKHGKCSKEYVLARSVEWKNKSHDEKYSHCIGKIPWNKGKKMENVKPFTEEHKRRISEAQYNKQGTMIVCEGVLYNNLRQASDVYEVTKQAVIVRLNSTTDKYTEFFKFDESVHNINDYIIYNECDIDDYRKRSYVYNTNLNNRLVSCEGKILTLTQATKYYNFKSSTSIVYRCESENWKDFFFV